MRDPIKIDTRSAARLTLTRPAPSLDERELKALAALAVRLCDLAEELLASVAAHEEEEIRWADLEAAYLLGGRSGDELAPLPRGLA